MSAFFINGKPAVINDLRKLRNPPSRLVIFVVVPFNKIPLFSTKLITFIISFIPLFVRCITEPVIDEILLLIFLPIILTPASIRISF